MSAPVAVHRAGPDDWERVRTVRLRALDDAPDAFWTRVEEEVALSSEQWRQRLASPTSATLLAVRDAADLGLVVMHPSSQDPTHAGLSAMWVAPEARGSGAADALITAGLAWARGNGYSRVRLWINDANTAAARLYRRHGFAPTGVTGTFLAPREHITEHELALEL